MEFNIDPDMSKYLNNGIYSDKYKDMLSNILDIQSYDPSTYIQHLNE